MEVVVKQISQTEQKIYKSFNILNNMEEIIERQKKEIEKKLSGGIVERNLEKKLKKIIDKKIVKVITGVRRSGKSTLALLVLKEKNFGYVNFDEKELIEVKLDDLVSVIKEIYGDVNILLLDEIQNIEKWELWVNSLQRRGYNLIITGSNAKLLSKELATHLTGRYIEFENFPFNFREFLKWKKFDVNNFKYDKEKQGLVKRLLREYLKKGGFPEYLVEDLSGDYLRTLFNSIIYTDIIKRWKIKYPVKLEDLARYLLSIFSREYTATKLKNLLGFRSVFTVLNYIKYIEEGFLIFTLERFSFKQKEFLKAPKKVYSVDLGLSNVVSTRVTRDTGLLMENLVFLELKMKGLKENKDIFYFKNHNSEIDFVLKEGLKVKQLIQVTYLSSKDEIEQRELRSLVKASDLLRCKDLLVITWDYESEEEFKGKKIKFLPLWKWLIGTH